MNYEHSLQLTFAVVVPLLLCGTRSLVRLCSTWLRMNWIIKWFDLSSATVQFISWLFIQHGVSEVSLDIVGLFIARDNCFWNFHWIIHITWFFSENRCHNGNGSSFWEDHIRQIFETYNSASLPCVNQLYRYKFTTYPNTLATWILNFVYHCTKLPLP